MERELISLILNIWDEEDLRAALNLKDYDEAIVILKNLYLDYDVFYGDYSFFDQVHEAIKNDDREKLDDVIAYSEMLFFIDVAVKLIEMYQKYDDDDKKVKNDPDYFRLRTELGRLDTITDEDVYKFINMVLKSKNKSYKKVESLKYVLNLKVDIEEKDDVVANYIEGLIYGNELTIYPLIEGVLLKNADRFMEEYLVMKYLKEKYYQCKTNELENYKYLIRRIEKLGLK